MNDTIKPIPTGTTETLSWVGGSANNDPTVAGNWSPADAPRMAADQVLTMSHGTMNLDSGNLEANQLNVNTGHDHSATINLKASGTLDMNVPDKAEAHANVNMSGGGEAVMNLFTGPTSDAEVSVQVTSSQLDLQANMSFGKLSVGGSGVTYLQGDSQINGANVLLNTTLNGNGSVELGSAGGKASFMELKADSLPSAVTVDVLDNKGQGGANGIAFDHLSVSAGGQVNLDNGFAEIKALATSYTLVNGELDLFSNGTKIEALNIAPAAGANPLSVGVAGNNTYIYNCAAGSLPIGSGSSSGGSGGMALVATPAITPLPMHV
jgi:hypothetical protein